MIVQRLIDGVRDKAAERKIEDLRVGIGYTAVLLDNGSCGLTFTFRNELGPKCGLVEEAGNVTGISCSDIIEWAMSTNLVRAAAGLAAINAIYQDDLEGFTRGDAFSQIDIRPDDTLGMIGYFKPVLDKVADKTDRIFIFERNITDDKYLYPDWAEDIYLPRCDVVLITGTTLLNKTIDHILEKCTGAREIAVMGPTATLCPHIFRDYGVSLLAGVKVIDPQRVLRIASEGGGGLSLEGSVRQVFKRLR